MSREGEVEKLGEETLDLIQHNLQLGGKGAQCFQKKKKVSDVLFEQNMSSFDVIALKTLHPLSAHVLL